MLAQMFAIIIGETCKYKWYCSNDQITLNVGSSLFTNEDSLNVKYNVNNNFEKSILISLNLNIQFIPDQESVCQYSFSGSRRN